MIDRRNRNGLFILVSLLVLGVLFVFTWINLGYIRSNPGGGQSFLVHWISLRGFLLEGVSPYSQEANQLTQREVYGRLARPGEDQLQFLSPVYVTVVFFPFALIPDVHLARALWMTLLQAALLLMAYFSARLANWRPGLILWVVYLLFVVFWFHSFQPLIEGDPIILVALMLTGVLVAVRNETDELAGLLLALATILFWAVLLPFMVIFVSALVHQRRTIVGWTIGTMVLLGATGALLQPDWILQNIWQIVAYMNNPPPGNIRAVLMELLPGMGDRLGYAALAFFAALVILEWVRLRKTEFRGFLWLICLTITVGLWLGPVTDAGNFILALPALPLVFAILEERWRRSGKAISFILMLILFAGLWGMYISNTGWVFARYFDLALFFPLPLFLLIVLYWVRWWAVRPAMWFDMIYQRENPGSDGIHSKRSP